MQNTTQEDTCLLKDTSAMTTALQHHPNMCGPISNLDHVWKYMENPPKYIDRIMDLVPRGTSVIKNRISDCHTVSSAFVPKIRLSSQSVPRTLVCHDMKGGYLEDKFISPINVGNGYTFYRWAHIDIFVYFSHHLITIPPLAWINMAHNNGVKILGTFITEWTPGKDICQEIFNNNTSLNRFVDILVDLCVLFKLDGWLLNIENALDDTTSLQKFVARLTNKLHAKRPGSLVIWYDSIIQNGKLKWQNELNEFNRCFFDLCDGIFLNYTWNEANLKKTVMHAEHRGLDVYVGVDVFGRNCYGGGNFNTYLAAEKIREYNLSMAIFAQGWTHETLPAEPSETLLERFLVRDNAFWSSLWPYLYTHPISMPFETLFYIGVDKDWFKLHSQEIQLSHFLNSAECPSEAKDVPTILGSCDCMQLCLQQPYTSCLLTKQNLSPETSYVHHLFSCDIHINGQFVLYFYTKEREQELRHGELNLIILVKRSNGSFQKVICHSGPCEQSVNNASHLDVNPCTDEAVINTLLFKNVVPNNWILKCYKINISNGIILEIGVVIESGDTACFCGIGLIDAAVLKSDMLNYAK